jgi:hypothetical protein
VAALPESAASTGCVSRALIIYAVSGAKIPARYLMRRFAPEIKDITDLKIPDYR